MNHPDDTIAAISTPPGRGGIGIVRLSGPEALKIAGDLFQSKSNRQLSVPTRKISRVGYIVDPETGRRIDEVILHLMPGPKTYTREDMAEINCHGGMMPVRAVLQILLNHGARLAEPGEFTKRAFLNGRIDLSQAEAVIDIIKSSTEMSEQIAMQQLEGRLSDEIKRQISRLTDVCVHIEAYIDFPEEDIEQLTLDQFSENIAAITSSLESLSKGYDEARFFREGVSAAIVGKPNVGKSSIMNRLLRRDRAIVTDLPGTTRDVLEEMLDIKGLPVRIMDTAGIREAHDLVEVEGVRRSLKALDGADVVIAVLDASRPADEGDREVVEKASLKKTIVVFNKSDKNPAADLKNMTGIAIRRADTGAEFVKVQNGSSEMPLMRVSASTGLGFDELKESLYSICIDPAAASSADTIFVTNVRHKTLIDKAISALSEAFQSIKQKDPGEITAISLREALDSLGQITGMVTTDDILNRIFSDFCIGK
ncbi:MAG: tRNA uridine-5-carboxymethylaminomethyl(34) synthesis GTPase MnmE [Dissulfurispiraceae bacterium]|jgi:tRNA modification GTPase|nr:tRNA uridine-5-carboxymethylaminomethyl(34) synthesis GTPase MnmE [Dissulfurispiraceae bacterium]